MKNVTLAASLLLLPLSAITASTYAPDRSHLHSLPVAELKVMYLECERLASHAFLDVDTAAYCSMVSEELLERSFGGNFNELLAWWRSVRRDCRQPNEPSEKSR